MINQAIETTLASFDFAFCIVVNVLTYLIIQVCNFINYKLVNNPTKKRIILLLCVIIVSIIYYIIGSDIKLIINSAVLAPVFWSWIMKPILAKFDLDYFKYDDYDMFK